MSLKQSLLVCLLACIFLGACSSIPRVPARGELFGQRVDTTVDSEIARYYLESWLPGKKEDRALDARIAALYRAHAQSIPSRDELKAIARNFSVDFAALFLADRLLNDECNRQLNERFERLLSDDTALDASLAASYQILFVPGWHYIENGQMTGADFAEPRALATRMGFENYLVPLPQTGAVEESARVLAAAIARHSRSGKQIILAGASSAGPVIHLTLGELLQEEELESVAAWLNIGGILQGTPFIDYFAKRPQRWLFDAYVRLKGFDKNAILSMSTAPSRQRFARLRLAPDIVVVNYMGIPLSGQLGQYSKTGYRMLRPDGPNDGLALLTDEIVPGSRTLVALGNDHFFAEDPQIDRKTIALMKLMVSYTDNPMALGCTGTRHEGSMTAHLPPAQSQGITRAAPSRESEIPTN